MSSRSLSGLTPQEISLIKAMLELGKTTGFHSGRIQSYFSRPDRTVNPARIYEVRDGKLGADYPPASETELHDFLSRFEDLPSADDATSRFPRVPPPAYIGVENGQVRFLARSVVITETEEDFATRSKLVEEQCRLAGVLSDAWCRFQVDQRLREHIDRYCDLAKKDHANINIFSLDTEFNILSKALGPDTGGLGEKGELQWERFTQNHVVLLDLYPEMRAYRAKLAELGKDIVLPEEEASQIADELLSPQAEEYVSPDVPRLIEKRLREDPGDDSEARRKRSYDVFALVSRTTALLNSVLHFLPRAASAASAAHILWNRVWIPLREFLRAYGVI